MFDEMTRVEGMVPARTVAHVPPEALTPLGFKTEGASIAETALFCDHRPIGGTRLPQGVFTLEEGAPVVCPLLAQPVLHATKTTANRAQAAAARMVFDTTKYAYKPSKAVRTRRALLLQFWLKEVFTKERVEAAVVALGELSLFKSKLSQDRIREYAEEIQSVDWLPEARQAVVKWEVVAKPGKAPRAVQDGGFPRLVANMHVAAVFEHILYASDVGKYYSIKGRPRCEVLDDIAKELGEDIFLGKKRVKMAAVELDQTGFEYHQQLESDGGRVSGLLDWERAIFDRIHKLIGDCAHEAGGSFRKVLTEMDRPETDLAAKPGGVSYGLDMKDPYRWRMAQEHLIRYSGDRCTSSANWLVEMGNTLCIILDDPTEVFRRRLEEAKSGDPFGTLGHWYASAFGGKTYFRPWTEGDDLLARCDAKLQAHQGAIESEYARLGLEAKLKIVVGTPAAPARAEFVAEHFVLVDGLCPARQLHCPDVSRGLITCGSTSSKADDATSIPCALMSKAVGYASGCPAVAAYLYSMAKAKARECGGGRMQAADAERVYGDSDVDFGTLEAIFHEAVSNCTLELSQQKLLLETSLEEPVDDGEWATFVAAAGSWDVGDCPEDIATWLPEALRRKFSATFV